MKWGLKFQRCIYLKNFMLVKLFGWLILHEIFDKNKLKQCILLTVLSSNNVKKKKKISNKKLNFEINNKQMCD